MQQRRWVTSDVKKHVRGVDLLATMICTYRWKNGTFVTDTIGCCILFCFCGGNYIALNRGDSGVGRCYTVTRMSTDDMTWSKKRGNVILCFFFFLAFSFQYR